jgi:hypothetical protein
MVRTGIVTTLDITFKITVAADGATTERYTLNGAEISRDEYFAAQFAALDEALAEPRIPMGPYFHPGDEA